MKILTALRASLGLLLAALPLGLAGCGATAGTVRFGDAIEIPRSGGDRITPLDYREASGSRVEAFVRDQPPLADGSSLADLLARVEAACVRVEVIARYTETGHELRLGSGVLVGEPPFVLTALHTLGAELEELRITLADGRILPVSPAAQGRLAFESSGDWALLELDPADSAGLSGVELGAPLRGDLCLVLGYPGGTSGREEGGRIVDAVELRGQALRPLVLIARVEKISPLVLSPVAGGLIEGGMSGGPIFDLEGRLVGTVAAHVIDSVRGGLRHSLHAAGVGAVAPWLPGRSPGPSSQPADPRRPAPSRPSAERRFLTPIDYYFSGERGVDAYVERAGADSARLRATIERCKQASVRVESSSRSGRGVREHSNGSGVLLGGGRLVLTAGHVVAGAPAERLEVLLADGRRRRARIVELLDTREAGAPRDWAVLELLEPVPDQPAIEEIAAAPPGAPTFALGYPGEHGTDRAGRVVKGDERRRPHLPLVCIGGVQEGEPPHSLELIAGSLGGVGASGGPIFDFDGRLVGLVHGITSSSRHGTTIRFTALESFEEDLRAHWPERR